MNRANIQEFITKNVSTLTGVGSKTKKLLKKKNIEKISDLLWSFPQGYTDRSNIQSLDKLEIGKITTIKVKVLKYNFPRIRNLPSKVICEDATGKIDIVFFNSREGYIRKFKEKPSPQEAFSNVINAGLYIIEPEVLALVPLGEKFDFSKQLFPMVLEKNWPMYAKTIDGVWFDVGNPLELLNAQSTLVKRMNELPFAIPEGSILPDDVKIDIPDLDTSLPLLTCCWHPQ